VRHLSERKLRTLRLKRGISQVELAYRFGIDRGNLSEVGKKNVCLPMLEVLARGFRDNRVGIVEGCIKHSSRIGELGKRKASAPRGRRGTRGNLQTISVRFAGGENRQARVLLGVHPKTETEN
jgi:transcriptional regulator with XRE-family HTH domain